MEHLYNAVTEEDFLRFDKSRGAFLHDGAAVTPEQVKSYAEQARTIKQLPVWELMVKEMQAAANDKMYQKSLSYDDMVAGKWMLYTLDILDKNLQTKDLIFKINRADFYQNKRLWNFLAHIMILPPN